MLTWNASAHNDDDNTLWCWLRAAEWINWPLFLSQSVLPILLLLWPWKPVVAATLIVNWLWYFAVGRRGAFVSVNLAGVGPFVAQSKWIICPVLGMYFYAHGQSDACWIAILWPIVVCSPIFSFVPVVNLLALAIMPPAPIRPIQDQFMMALGYIPKFASREEALAVKNSE